jgi:hypothetical protein
MGGPTSPPGRTFRERWPHDAATADWLARPFVPIVLGGVAGLLAAPVWLFSVTLSQPVVTIVVLAIAVITSILLDRSAGRPRAIVARGWRVSIWWLLMVALGWLLSLVGVAVCTGDLCTDTGTSDASWVGAALPIFVLTVAGSTLGAVAIDRLGMRLARRRSAGTGVGMR